MDPLSTTASIIAVIGAGGGAVKAVEKLRAFYDAPDEVSQLINEVSDLHAVLSHVASFANQLKEEPLHGPVVGLNCQLDRAAESLRALDSLINKELIKVCQDGSSKFSRKAWMKKKSTIQRLQSKLKDMRMDILMRLHSVMSSAVSRLEISVLEIRTEVLSTSNLLALLNTKIGDVDGRESVTNCNLGQLIKPEVSSSSIAYPQGHRYPNGDHQNTGSPHQDSRPGSSKLCIVTGVTTPGGCKGWCSCACHARRKFRTPKLIERIVGELFVGYSGMPVTTPPCTEKSCKRRATPSLRLKYYFPTWLVSRAVVIGATFGQMIGPEFWARMPRRIPQFAPIWIAAQDGDISTLQSLFSSRKASPFDVDPAGWSALLYAAMSRQTDTCRFLIQQGADKYLENNFGLSPMDTAWKLVLVNAMSKKVAEQTAVVFGDKENYITTCQFSVVHKIVLGISPKPLGPELDASTAGIDAVDSHGHTALFWAVARNDVSMARILLDFGADPDIKDPEDRSALTYAAILGRSECANLLLDYGADAGGKDVYGSTILHYVRHNIKSDPTLIERLVRAGADINATNLCGNTALSMAAWKGNLRYARCLLQANADPNIAGAEGISVVVIAILNRHDALLEEMLKYGIDFGLLDYGQRSILHFTAWRGTKTAMELLLKARIRGVSPELEDAEGWTCRGAFEDRQAKEPDEELAAAFEALLASLEPDDDDSDTDSDSDPLTSSSETNDETEDGTEDDAEDKAEDEAEDETEDDDPAFEDAVESLP